MLTHMIQASEGIGNDAVKLNDRTVNRFRLVDTCHSGIRTNGSGVLQLIQANGGFSSVSGEWLIFGSSATFYIQRTIISGTLEVDPGAGFLQMNTNRTYDNQKASVGVKTTVVFFEIASDASGTPIVDTATMTFISERESSQ